MAALTHSELTHHPNIVHLTKNLIKPEHEENSSEILHKNKFQDQIIPSETLTSTTQNNEDESADQQEPPVIDIVINNVVCSFNVRCHLNLRQIALTAYNVEYIRERQMLTMKLRSPYTTASIWSSGKVTCTGATSEELSKKAARRITRIFQKLGFRVRFTNFRVVNVLGTCSMPFGIKIAQFSVHHRTLASYEPELHPGVTYKIAEIKATLKIFSTGSITITAPSVANVQGAVEHIFPLVYEFRKDLPPKKRTAADQKLLREACNVVVKRHLNQDLTEADSDEENLCIDSADEYWD